MFKITKNIITLCLVVLLFSILVPKTFAVDSNIEKDMLLVFDASGSMTDQFGGISRIDALKIAVDDLMDSLDNTVMVGLRPFAQIKRADKDSACKETTLAQNFTLTRSIIKTQTKLLQAVGEYTPLAYTLNTAEADFKAGNDNVLLLLTDGKDTCGGDPVKAAGDLFNSSKKIKVYVVGMGVDSETKKQLELIASTGGGVYYDANDSVTLASSFKTIQNLEQPKERVGRLTPLGGRPVSGGNDWGTAEYLLPSSGDYRLTDSLAPGQYAYFKFPLERGDEEIKIKISLTILGDRMGVNYNPVNNSFEESNLHNYRMEFFDDKTFPTTEPIEIKDSNLLKKSFIISGTECGGGNNPYYCYIKIGSKDFAISKYDLFKIETVKDDDVNTVATATAELKDDDSNKTNNILIYILSSIIVILLITLLLIFRKRKSNNDISSKPVV